MRGASEKVSCGMLMFRRNGSIPEYFLVHPGGPFFKNKDEGFWTIPKGLPDPDESYEAAAIREFEEETGIKPVLPFIFLGSRISSGNKMTHIWAFETFDKATGQNIKSNLFNLEWPPKSGKIQQFPEIDKGGFFDFDMASKKINRQQLFFLSALHNILLNKEIKS